MLGNLDMMVRELGDNAEPVQNEIDLVIEQIYRIRDIINRLLHYNTRIPTNIRDISA